MENLSSINVVSAHTQDRGKCNLPPASQQANTHICQWNPKENKKIAWCTWISIYVKTTQLKFQRARDFPIRSGPPLLNRGGILWTRHTRLGCSVADEIVAIFLPLSCLYHSAVQLVQKRSTSRGGGEVIGKAEIMSSESCAIVPIARLDIRVAYKWRFFGPFGGEWRRCTALEIDILIRNSHFHISLNTRRCVWGNSSACIQIFHINCKKLSKLWTVSRAPTLNF